MSSKSFAPLLTGLLAGAALATAAISSPAQAAAKAPRLPSANFVALQEGPGEDYVIGPMDELTVFVWRNPELGAKVQVRPDGRINTPLIADLPATGKTPSMLAQDIQLQLSQYIQDPLVSVIVNRFAGTFSEQIRVVGATGRPASIPYRANMTILDAMIAVGGMNEFASGNRSKLVRFDKATGKQKEFSLRLADLFKRGDAKANVMLMPGDVIIIPESIF